MKYEQTRFTKELAVKIIDTELELQVYIETLLTDYKSIFAMRNLNLDIEFKKEGQDPFESGYSSSVSIGIFDKKGELVYLYVIKICEHEHSFFGMPITQKNNGFKIMCDFMDVTIEDIKKEIKNFLEEYLDE